MDARQSFKAAFIARCIDAGVTAPAAIAAEAVKAAGVLGDVAGLGTKAVDALKGVAVPAAVLGLAAPPVVGGVLGTLASKATDLNDSDVAEARNQEVIDEYSRQADRLRREGSLRRYARGTAGRVPTAAGLL